ncbi:hypothetical protein LXL04_010658 [Taraxacum kok-saghyz]
MASENITMLADLGLARDDYTIKVRIVRLWKQMNWSNPNQRLGRGLDEYVDVYIHRPTLGMNRDTMKFSNSDHKMYFYSTTKVTKCTDFVGPKNCFSFSDFPSLIDEKIPTNMSIDVIGNVFKVYPMVPKAINKDQSVTMKMEDLNGTIIWITLFGAYADQIVDYVAETEYAFAYNPGITNPQIQINYHNL